MNSGMLVGQEVSGKQIRAAGRESRRDLNLMQEAVGTHEHLVVHNRQNEMDKKNTDIKVCVGGSLLSRLPVEKSIKVMLLACLHLCPSWLQEHLVHLVLEAEHLSLSPFP